MPSTDLGSSPWLIRIFDRVPLPLPVMGLLIALAYYIFITLLALLLHPPLGGELLYGGWLSPSKTVAIYAGKALMVGYLAASACYGHRGAVRDLQSLRPALSCDDIEFDHWLTRLRHVPRAPLHIATVFIVALAFFAVQRESNWSWMERPPPLGSGMMSFSQIDAIIIGFLMFRTMTLELISAFLFAQVARRFARIELFALERVAPFSRRSLRAVLVLVLFMVILSLKSIFEPNPGGAITPLIMLSLVAVAVFLIPLIPLQRRINAAKQSELARIRADIRLENEARATGDEDWVRLTGLIAYKREIEQVSTWAFSTPTVFRFALYVSLGIGSWVGAAFVERWLGTLLGS
jgi:hypothetical protein